MNNMNGQTQVAQAPATQNSAWSFSAFTNANMCNKGREFTFETKDTNLPENYYRKSLIMECIKAALQWGERRSEAIMDYLNSRYDDCGYKNTQQRQMNLLWDHKRVMRYLNCETRKATFLEGGVIVMNGQSVKVKPDVCFIDDSKKSIELVRFQVGRPYLTQSGKKNAVIRDLKLFSMILYGRELGYQNITASIYYLQKNDDVISGLAGKNFNPDFFEGGGNIVSLTDEGYMGHPTELDKLMEDAFAVMNTGIDEEKMHAEDCEKCPKYDICQYTLPPIRLEEEASTKDISNLKLTQAQTAAVNVTNGFWRINAGAGAGKTMVTALRVWNLLNQGVRPEEILLITFTNAGAKEMRDRIQLCIETFKLNYRVNLDDMIICTFNAFGDLVIGDNYANLGYTKKPKIIDDVERYGIIARLMNEHPIPSWTGESFLYYNSRQKHQKGALAIVSEIFRMIKQRGGDITNITASDVRDAAYNCDVPDVALMEVIKLYPLYAQQLMDRNLIEYVDQEILPFQVFESVDPSYLNNRFLFKHIIVDEFQDSNEGQIELLKILKTLPTFQSLMVVGDDSQAIFGFRETSPEYIINFASYIGEQVQDIFLVENHRSTPEIIEFANKLNSLNKEKVEKDLVATRPSGAGVVVNGFYSRDDEYDWIVQSIKQQLDNGRRPEQIAVIAYTKAELQRLADALSKHKLPTVLLAPEKLMTNSRIRAILSFVRVLGDSADTKDALIAANAVVGGCIMDLPNQKIQQLVDNIIVRAENIRNAASLAAKKDGLMKFIDSIAMDDETVQAFKESLETKEYGEILQYCIDFSLYGEDTEYRRVSNYPGIVLTTAHSSKGLEWPVVYNTVTRYQTQARVSEETRRLLFVSATRARDELYISGTYAAFGKGENLVKNHYLQEAFDIVGKQYNPTFSTSKKTSYTPLSA